MVINPKDLSDESLTGVLESFISRDGTDYGEVELSLSQKVASLKPQVQRGEVLIVFDPISEEVNLVSKEAYLKEGA